MPLPDAAPIASLGGERSLCAEGEGASTSGAAVTSSPLMATYLSYGGAERERAVRELWEDVCERASAGHLVDVEALDIAHDLGGGWRDTKATIAAALLARAYDQVFECVESISVVIESEGTVGAEKLEELTQAHNVYKTAETLCLRFEVDVTSGPR